MEAKYANTDDAAAYLRVSTATLRTWVKAKKIPEVCYFKLGGTYRFHLDRLEEYLRGDLDAVISEEQRLPEQLEFEFVRAGEGPAMPEVFETPEVPEPLADDEPQVTYDDVDEDY